MSGDFTGKEYLEDDVNAAGGDFDFDFNPWWIEQDNDQEFNSVITPVFGELLQTGWNWGREQWEAPVSEEVMNEIRPRINKKIERKFFMRELSIEIPARWRILFLGKLEEIMEKLGPLYNEISKGIDLSGIEESKSRIVNSEYPQAQLQTSIKDYASDATETGSQKVSSFTTLEALEKYNREFSALDTRVLNELECMFSSYPYFLSSQLGPSPSRYSYYNNYNN